MIQAKLTFVLVLCMRLFLESCAASDICSICNCGSSQTTIYCSALGLTSVPDSIPPNVELLSMQYNRLYEIQAGSFNNLPNLTTLSLKYNDIYEIQAGSFHNLPNLTTLNLYGNNIKEIKGEIFQNISNLTSLDLGGNGLKEIKAELFQYLSGLKSLNLSGNNIKEIKGEIFQNVSSLTSLDLSGNSLKEIKAELFQYLSGLTTLDLQNNHIEKIEARSFQGLPRLNTLYLSYNRLNEIKAETFRNLSSLTYLYLQGNNMKKIEVSSFEVLPSLLSLDLSSNRLKEIKGETFRNLSNLTYLYLGYNHIEKIEARSFQGLPRLNTLNLGSNNIKEIKGGIFQNLFWLKTLDLSNNRIQNYEDGAFLFLPNINYIDLRKNTEMMCGCHLPALVNHTKSMYNRTVDVKGECQTDSSNNQNKVIPILEYSLCKNYSLFRRNLQCQTCSGTICKDSEVTNCGGDEPVCHIKLSMNGIKPMIEKSCSTYRTCINAIRSNHPFACNKWTNGSSCVACCIGNLCNKNDFMGWSNSFVFHLILISTLKKVNEYKNMSRAMERELSNLKGAFGVEYCSAEGDREVFTITCTVPDTMSKDQASKQILETLKTSQTLRDFGFQQNNMKLIDERVCDENSTKTSNETFYWPLTKIETNATISCHANVATRYCSARTAARSEMPTSQNVTSPKCSPFTGIWQEPDMSQCYNTQRITQQLKNITSEIIAKENIEEVSTILLNISKKSVYFKEEDIDLTVDILEKMVSLISNVSANITVNNIFPSINNMINTPEEVLVKAEQSERIGNRMLKNIEAIPDKIPLEGQQLTVVYSNLGIGVIKVDADTFSGTFYGVSYGNNENESKTMVYDKSDSNPQVDDTVDFISLPKNLLKHLKEEDRPAVSRISFISLKDDKLYRVIRNSGPEETSEINSNIIAANIPNISVTNLDEPIKISFHLKDKNANRLQCVYWDESSGQSPNWSPEGCSISEDGPGGKVICSCNHLTSFAVLKNVYQDPVTPSTLSPNSVTPSTLSPNSSYIGCGISLVCFILTVIIHVCFKLTFV